MTPETKIDVFVRAASMSDDEFERLRWAVHAGAYIRNDPAGKVTLSSDMGFSAADWQELTTLMVGVQECREHADKARRIKSTSDARKAKQAREAA